VNGRKERFMERIVARGTRRGDEQGSLIQRLRDLRKGGARPTTNRSALSHD